MSALTALGWLLTDPLAAHRKCLGRTVGFIGGYVASAGVIGLAVSLGVVPRALVMLPSALNANPDFIHFAQAFQSWPAVLFLVVGSVMVLQQLGAERAAFPARRCHFSACARWCSRRRSRLRFRHYPEIYRTGERDGGPGTRGGATTDSPRAQRSLPLRASSAASEQTTLPIPTGLMVGLKNIAVTAQPVVFILAPVQGTAEGYPRETRNAIGYVRDDLHAAVTEQGSGIWVLMGAQARHPLSGASLDHQPSS